INAVQPRRPSCLTVAAALILPPLMLSEYCGKRNIPWVVMPRLVATTRPLAVASACSPLSPLVVSTLTAKRWISSSETRGMTYPSRLSGFGLDFVRAVARELRHRGPSHRQQDHDDRARRQCRGDRIAEQDRRAAAGDDQRLAQRHLGTVAEYEAEHQRHGRIFELVQDIADQAEGEHNPDIEQRVAEGEDAHDAQGHDEGVQDPRRAHGELGEDRDEDGVEDDQNNVADIHAGKEAPDDVRIIPKQKRAWAETL